MTARSALWLENAGAVYNAGEYRQLLRALTGGSVGVAFATDLKVTQRAAGANMSVDVAPGGIVIVGTQGAPHQGEYFQYHDAVTNLAIAAADATFDRIDLIVERIRDQEYSGADNDGSLIVVTGIPNDPEPAPPNNARIIASVLVDNGVGSILNPVITDRRPYINGPGGTQVVTSTTRPTVTRPGMPIFETDTGKNLRRDAADSAWVAAGNIIVCTSVTRPTGFDGLVIVETDTDRLYIHDGTSYRIPGTPYGKTAHVGAALVMSSTNWADANGSLMDIALPAIAGDVLEVSLDGQYVIIAGETTYLDVRCVTSGAYFGSAVEPNIGQGIISAQSQPVAGVAPFAGHFYRTLVAGDITAGVVTLRVRYREVASGASRNSIATAANVPFTFFARNLGPDRG